MPTNAPAGALPLITGDASPQAALDNALEEGLLDVDHRESGRWLPVHREGSRAGNRDMQAFIADLDDAHAAEHLSIAMSGRRDFRRFQDALSAWPDQ